MTGVAPNTGTTAGGRLVTITGTGFTGATAVTVLRPPRPQSFTVNSGTQITVTTPPHAAGVVNIYIRDAAGNSPAVTADRYTFVAPRPSVTEGANASAKPVCLGGLRLSPQVRPRMSLRARRDSNPQPSDP